MGPPLVWIPATLWLLYTGDTCWAIFMAIWGFFVISIDNTLPADQPRKSPPILLVFLGVIGGVLSFGFVGIFIGPTLLAVGFTLLQEWIATATGKPAKVVRVVRPGFRRSKTAAAEEPKEDGGRDA
jgi:predicted PurR-regulated permease PerM